MRREVWAVVSYAPDSAAVARTCLARAGDILKADSRVNGQEKHVKVGYVVLYVNDPAACLRFWTEQVGMVEKGRSQAGDFSIVEVGFADQDFSFELVPLALMKDNPDGLDLATPSIAFRVPDLDVARATLVANGVAATEVGEHSGMSNFAFPDNEGRWFAVIRA